MNVFNSKVGGPARRTYSELVVKATLGTAYAMLVSLPAHAVVLYEEGGTEIRWDNTFKYSVGQRLKSPSSEVLAAGAGPNGDDGNLNFKRGSLISNRLDWLSELDLRVDNKFGARLSAAAWYDTVYNRGPATQSNPNFPFSTSNTFNEGFSDRTRKMQGRYAEVLDAFVFANFDLGSAPTTVRLGQHTLVWGESLFMASNGIASAMSPLNIAKGAAVPNTPAKELFMPVPQFSFSSQVANGVTLEGYMQFRWEGSRLPAAGSYFSDVDIYGPGGNNLLTPPQVPLWAPFTPLHREDINPSDSGQFGLALKFYSDSLDTDFGIYALRYHAKSSPVNFYLSPVGAPSGCGVFIPGQGCAVPQFGDGKYGFLYGEDITLYGASASTTIGDWNVGGEVSYRRNEALRTSNEALTAPDASLLARGDTLHYQISGIRVFSRSALWDSASLVVELGGHRLTSFRKNEANFDTAAASHSAFGGRMVFAPTYYQVTPGLDVEIPIGLGYSSNARSPIDNKFNMGGANKGGDLSIGANFTYRNLWKAGVNYTTYFGKVEDGQALRDRDFISAYIQRSF